MVKFSVYLNRHVFIVTHASLENGVYDWVFHWHIKNTTIIWFTQVLSNLNSSNQDGLFTIANSNSFLSPYDTFPIAQENKHFRKISYFIMKLYVICTHENHLIEVILMSTFNISLLSIRSKKKSLNFRLAS